MSQHNPCRRTLGNSSELLSADQCRFGASVTRETQSRIAGPWQLDGKWHSSVAHLWPADSGAFRGDTSTARIIAKSGASWLTRGPKERTTAFGMASSLWAWSDVFEHDVDGSCQPTLANAARYCVPPRAHRAERVRGFGGVEA